MPTFSTEAEIEAYMLRHSRFAIRAAQEKVYKIIETFLKQYYSDYTPKEYIRTYNLLRSLVKSDVRQVGNGWEAEVYFDASALDYEQGVMPLQHTDEHGRYGWATWGADQVLSTALHGSHGGYTRTAPIYEQSMNVLNAQAINTLKENLIRAGIPVV